MSEGGKRNSWLTHVKKTMKSHKGMKFGQVLKLAKKTYKKGMHGGAEGATEGTSSATLDGGLLAHATPVGGRRKTRRGRKSRRGGGDY
jgi:hypothetical protein